ncbi:uncharacterized protein LOC136031580 [Artemia franciscana]|uniref:uncharacterized protein LOC136031580 n=1 Tax=Artemia franciscana TaxID=6661 RepID=UPI0032D9DF6E
MAPNLGLFANLLFLSFAPRSHSIRLIDLVVPSAVLLGQDVMLECRYDLENDGLYSLKWYKGNEEIFCYIPEEEFPSDRMKSFNLPGVNILVEKSNDHQILLQNVDFDSTGKYRCEIVAEGSFQTINNVGQMNVVKLPAEDPIITGGLAHYVVGDLVKVNCTSRKSLPAANLTWYINGELSDKNFLQNYPIIEDEESGLQTIIIGLEFEVRQKHLKTGGLKIKCTATLAAVYWRSDERSAEAAAIKSAHNHSERDTQQHMSSPSKNVNDWMSNRGSIVFPSCIIKMTITTVLLTAKFKLYL